MNIHNNARTTPQGRAVLVARVLQERWPVNVVAAAFGISRRTVHKWLARYRAEGIAGLQDRRPVPRRGATAGPRKRFVTIVTGDEAAGLLS